MARFTQPARSTFEDPEDLAGYDAVIERCRIQGLADASDRVGDYWGGLLNSPMLTGIASAMGTFVRRAGERDNTYTHAQREFVDQVLSADQKSNVVQGWHIEPVTSSIMAISTLLPPEEFPVQVLLGHRAAVAVLDTMTQPKPLAWQPAGAPWEAVL